MEKQQPAFTLVAMALKESKLQVPNKLVFVVTCYLPLRTLYPPASNS